ncbi:unnamed protein product [Merluccius merluccius]
MDLKRSLDSGTGEGKEQREMKEFPYLLASCFKSRGFSTHNVLPLSLSPRLAHAAPQVSSKSACLCCASCPPPPLPPLPAKLPPRAHASPTPLTPPPVSRRVNSS